MLNWSTVSCGEIKNEDSYQEAEEGDEVFCQHCRVVEAAHVDIMLIHRCS